MTQSSPQLRRLLPKEGKLNKDAMTNLLYPGGAPALVGANSPVGLAGTLMSLLLADEIDRYPTEVGLQADRKEGNPLLPTPACSSMFVAANRLATACSWLQIVWQQHVF